VPSDPVYARTRAQPLNANPRSPPASADFDGDEMNLHVPQTEESRTEALELMSTKKNMVTPRNGEPIIAAIQDFITAAYLLSRKDKFYDRQVDLPPPTVWKPVRLWTGKQVFNVLMKPTRDSPINVNLEAKCRTLEAPAKGSGFPLDMSPNDGYLVIRNSEIMCGVMDKATVGDGKKNSVFGVILRDYGSDEAAIAMNRLAKLCARWLANVGFSLGINDVIPGPLLLAQKTELIQQSYDVCADLIDQAKRGVLKNAPGSDQAGTLEMKLSGELSGVRAACGELCMAELSRHNAPATMATCGSKGARPTVPCTPLRPLTPFACLSLAGSKLNVAQMVAVVGQQIIAGSRVVDGFQDRFLPHFRKKAREPPAKGFVANSFFSGLSPTEFLAHAMSGREGLVDTAVKTAETGYMARRLMKVGRYLAGGSLPTDLWVSLTSSASALGQALEDLSTRYDDSVRNSEGKVVQFKYGDDGLDPACLEGESSPVAFPRSWTHAKGIADVGGRSLLPWEVKDILNQALDSDDFKRNCEPEYLNSVEDFVLEKVVQPMVAIRQKFGLYPADEFEEETEGMDLDIGADRESRVPWVKPSSCSDPVSLLTRAVLLSAAETRTAVANLCKVTDHHLNKFLEICYVRYLRAKIEPGAVARLEPACAARC
jgi:DNA-directed RNA polymerase III subunit RPC1